MIATNETEANNDKMKTMKCLLVYLFFVQGLKCKWLGVWTPAKLVLGPASGKKLKSHQEIGILHFWNFQDVAISPKYICHMHTALQIHISHLMCTAAETFVTSVATSLATVVTLTATFSQTAICGLCFIIHHTKANSATLSILLHHSYCSISNYWFIAHHRNNSVIFWFIGNNSVTFVCLCATILWHFDL